jgi:hypothetical protein
MDLPLGGWGGSLAAHLQGESKQNHPAASQFFMRKTMRIRTTLLVHYMVNSVVNKPQKFQLLAEHHSCLWQACTTQAPQTYTMNIGC